MQPDAPDLAPLGCTTLHEAIERSFVAQRALRPIVQAIPDAAQQLGRQVLASLQRRCAENPGVQFHRSAGSRDNSAGVQPNICASWNAGNARWPVVGTPRGRIGSTAARKPVTPNHAP